MASTFAAVRVARIRTATTTPMIIAIDGPAGSGKGTLGKRLAAHYGYRHLDTGLLYRAVAKALLDAGAQPQDETAAIAAASSCGRAPASSSALATAR